MTDLASQPSQRLFDRVLARTRAWIFVAISLSLVVCAAIAAVHYLQKTLLQSLRASHNEFRQSRIDLAEGFLHLSLSGEEDTPYERDQGLTLLRQALAEMETALRRHAPATESPILAVFQQDVAALRQLLADTGGNATLSPKTKLQLRILLNDLERQADLVDSRLREEMHALSVRHDRLFTALLLGSALLLGGVCYIVVAAVQAAQRSLAQLKASEARYRELFEGNPHPMWVFDLETLAFLAVNDAAVAAYGYSRAEFLAMTIRDIRPREELPALYDVIHRDGGPVRRVGVWTHRWKDGTLRQVEIVTHDLDFDGRPARLVLASDVTARLAAEGEIRKLNAELEVRVEERTRELEESATELEAANETLQEEIEERLRIEESLLAATAELETKNAELERINRLFVGRELRMRELKERLAAVQGTPPRDAGNREGT